MPSPTVHAFAAAAPGLEPLVRAELAALGTGSLAEEPGGVAFRGRAHDVYRANLWLRTASRVVVRLAEFHATTFFDLERLARQIQWERYAAPGQAVRFRVTCRKSRLYHSDAVAQRMADALDRRLGGGAVVVGGAADEDAEDDGGPADVPAAEADGDEAQLFVVRFFRDQCTVSADSSGALLHRRGYRQALAKAPLRETLAAAMLAGAGYTGDRPLLDPLCGAGTVPVEGALLARRIAPGAGRDFAFTRWPGYDAARWQTLLGEARSGELAAAPFAIQGSDRDEGAIAAARRNAERAGVASDVEFTVRPVSAIAPPPGPGVVVTNPPYGIRTGERDRLRNLYGALGNVLRARCEGWTAAFLVADAQLTGQLRLPVEERFATTNGGIPVRLEVGPVV